MVHQQPQGAEPMATESPFPVANEHCDIGQLLTVGMSVHALIDAHKYISLNLFAHFHNFGDHKNGS